MKTLNVASARDSFSRLVDEVHESGEGVIVAKYGHPLVMLVPFVESKPKRNPYPLRGMPYRMADDFDDPMPELATMVAESAQARERNILIISADRKIRKYPFVKTIWE